MIDFQEPAVPVVNPAHVGLPARITTRAALKLVIKSTPDNGEPPTGDIPRGRHLAEPNHQRYALCEPERHGWYNWAHRG